MTVYYSGALTLIVRFCQIDLNEKNHQVEMMWDIYGNATAVCI